MVEVDSVVTGEEGKMMVVSLCSVWCREKKGVFLLGREGLMMVYWFVIVNERSDGSNVVFLLL